MNNNTQPQIAELADKSMLKIVMAVFLIAVFYILQAAETVIDEHYGFYLNSASIVVVLLACSLLLTIFWLKIRKFDRQQKKVFFNSIEHGFYEKVLNNSIKASFLFSFIFIQSLKIIAKRVVPDAPLDFYLYVIMAFMLLSACFVFIIKARSENIIID